MNIGVVYSNYHLAHITGQAGIMYLLAKKLQQRGAGIYTISNSTISDKKTEDTLLLVGDGNAENFLKHTVVLTKYIKEKNLDLLIVHGMLFSLFIAVLKLICFRKIKVVAIYSETLDQFSTSTLFIFRMLRNYIGRYIVTSNHLAKQLQDLKIVSQRIMIARIGLKSSFSNHSSAGEEPYDLLYFGDSSTSRGFDLVVALTKKLPSLNILLLIRKRDQDDSDYFKALKSRKNVTTLFYPYKKSLSTYVRQSKIILLPFRWMSMRPPISIIESMAASKVLLTSTLGGNEELISNGIDGFTLSTSNIFSWTKIIKALMSDKKRRRAIGQATRKKILDLYSEREYDKIFSTLVKLNETKKYN